MKAGTSEATEGVQKIVSSRMLRVVSDDWSDPDSFFECLRGEALQELLLHAVVSGGDGEPSYSKRRTLLLFDVALRVHGGLTFATASSIRKRAFAQAQRWFCGAMWSEHFIAGSAAFRQDTCAALSNLLTRTSLAAPVPADPIPQPYEYPTYGKRVPQHWVENFDSSEKAHAALRALRPDVLYATDGEPYRVDLSAMREVLSNEYTDRFLGGLQAIATGKKKDAALRDFGTSFSNSLKVFQAEDGQMLTPSCLLSPGRVQELLEAFRLSHYLRYLDRKPVRGKVKELDSTQKMWGRYKNYWSALHARGLVAWPTHDFPPGSPNLESRQGPLHRETTSSATGAMTEVTQKLITPIPLQVSDEQATELFFVRVRKEFFQVQGWLDSRLQQLWGEYLAGGAMARETSPTWPSLSTQFDLPTAVRYFRDCHSGYIDTTKHQTLVFPLQIHGRKLSGASRVVELSDLSRKLGLPTKEDAITLVAYLMSTDGRFTEAALSDCRIFDKDGIRINATDERGAMLLVTEKHRKRGDNQHDVVLSEPARQRVLQWLLLTEPIRQEMRSRGVPGWDRLFVYLRSPMGGPSFLRRSPSLTSAFRTLCQKHGHELGHLSEIATPSRIRAQKGLLRFLENFSIQEMADELGNEPTTTLRSYLPSAAWDFFARRWVRIFQSLLIVKAAPKSVHLLRATGFSSLDEVDQLLANHTFNVPSSDEATVGQPQANSAKDRPKADVVVGVTEESLKLMASLSAAVELAIRNGSSVSPKSIHWAEFFGHLRLRIEGKLFHDVYLKAVLANALQTANPALYRNLIHG
jgi:hypothetical protein